MRKSVWAHVDGLTYQPGKPTGRIAFADANGQHVSAINHSRKGGQRAALACRATTIFHQATLQRADSYMTGAEMIMSWVDNKLQIGGFLALIALGVTAAALPLEKVFGHAPSASFIALIVVMAAAWRLAQQAAKR